MPSTSGAPKVAVLSAAPKPVIAPLVRRLAESFEVVLVAIEGPPAVEPPPRAHGWNPLRWMDQIAHPGPVSTGGTLEDLCRERSIPLIVSGFPSRDLPDRLRESRADVAVVYGRGTLDAATLQIPLFGALGLREVPGIGTGIPMAYWELLAGMPAVDLTVRQLAGGPFVGGVWVSGSVPISRGDLPESLTLKADLLARDLIVESLTRMSSGQSPKALVLQSGLWGRPAPLPRSRRRFRALCREHMKRSRKSGPRVLLRKVLAGIFLYCGYVQVRNALRRRRGHVPAVIVNFHRVGDSRPDHWMTVGTARFAEFAEFLRRWYRVVPIGEVRSVLEKGRNTEHLVAITFDDGYKECATSAVAALERLQLPAAFFVCSATLNEGRPLPHDHAAGFPDVRTMTSEDARRLVQRGFEVGSHSLSHADFRTASLDEIEHEVAGSKGHLEKLIGAEVRGFAVPFGSVDHCRPELFHVARRAAYDYVLSHFDGANFPGKGRYHLRRVRPPLDGILTLHAAVEGWRGFSGLFTKASEAIVLDVDDRS